MMTKNSGPENFRPSGPGSPAQIAAAVRQRSRRRAGCIGIAALLLWTGVAVGAIVIVYGVFVFIWPSLTHVASLGPKATDRDWALVETALRVVPQFGIPLVYVWGGLVVMAAIATMLYVRSSHNASLVQIREELRDLSVELQQLAHKGGSHVE